MTDEERERIQEQARDAAIVASEYEDDDRFGYVEKYK